MVRLRLLRGPSFDHGNRAIVNPPNQLRPGEFGFVLFGAAYVAGVIAGYEFNLAMLGIGVSMTLTPLLVNAADVLGRVRIQRSKAGGKR